MTATPTAHRVERWCVDPPMVLVPVAQLHSGDLVFDTEGLPHPLALVQGGSSGSMWIQRCDLKAFNVQRWTFDELTDDLSAFFGLIALGLLVLPGVIPGVRDPVLTWLLEHHLVVPAVEACFTIPLTSVGLDVRRIVVAALVALAVVSLLAWLRLRRNRLNSRQP